MSRLSEAQFRWLLAGVGAGCFALLLTLEVLTQEDEIRFLDFVGDAASILLTIGAAVGVALLLQRIQGQHEEQMALIRDLEVARAEGNGWRSKVQSHMSGLKAEMDTQFQSWGMTSAEREVGLLILKGLSHKEIAQLRATSDATVRQQAQAIYRKARLPGKTAFSAYFLDDLFAADGAEAGDGRQPSRAGNGGGPHAGMTPIPVGARAAGADE